ncbi:DNA-binding protein, partial [Paracoccus fontiphilus]
MARKSTITPETVAAAAEALITRGEPVTNKSVLSEIGSGSMSTLVPLLQAWRETQRETQELAEVEVPDALAASAERLASQLWKAAMVEATAGHEALRRELV